jgi:protein-L-isoaspartate(D-aspartate) O-methyltransferase
MVDFAVQRTNMVDSQIRPSDVTDRRIPRAMLEVPREVFVPAAARATAYLDDQIRVTGSPGSLRFLLAPRVLAKMLQHLEVGETETVLDIGGATGYSAAILSKLAKSVIALECEAALAEHAAATLKSIGVLGVTVHTGPLAVGYPTRAPYDAILVNGALPDVPATLLDQLKDGGRLVAVMTTNGVGRATLWRRYGTQFDHRTLFDAAGAPLPGFEKPAAFVL